MENFTLIAQYIHKVLHLNLALEKMNFQYLLIWFGMMILITVIVILLRISPTSSTLKVENITTVPKDEIALDKYQNVSNNIKNDDIKSKVMMNHTKYLRKLHAASERCYIKQNALKCIQIVSYCPHLVNVKNVVSGMTPFHNVCSYGHIGLVSYMLDRGANPWLCTDAGETALCLAIQACIKNPDMSLECIKYLQKRGCYLDHTNKWYKIYLESALLTKNRPLARWMFDQASLLGERHESFPLTRV